MMNLRSPDHVVITFDGVDAVSFLQSQLTNDVAALALGAWQWQGYCTAKGRLQATFALVRTGEIAFAAVLHHSVADGLVKRLAMFRMRAKLTIEKSATIFAQLHFALPDQHVTADSIATLDLGHGRWITLSGDAKIAVADAAFMTRWNVLGIEAMQAEVTAATHEMFVPQMLNWDHVQPGGGVSFSKGCYPGQEVVARAHYRGAVKRQLERQTLATGANAAPGAETQLTDGRNAEICNTAGNHALVVVGPLAAAPAPA